MKQTTVFSSEDETVCKVPQQGAKQQSEGANTPCEESSNSHHLGEWLLLETKGTTAARHHTGIYTGCFSWLPPKRLLWQHFVVWAGISEFTPFWHRCWNDRGKFVPGFSLLTCPLQHTTVSKHYFVRSVLPPWNLPLSIDDGWMDGGEINLSPKPPISAPSGQNWSWSGDRAAGVQLSCHWSGEGFVVSEKYLFLLKNPFCSEWQSIATWLPSNPGLWVLGTWGAILDRQRDFLTST